MNNMIGVMFTGGLDSTYLVYKNLEAGHYVSLYYVDLANNDNKTVRELTQIETLWRVFNEKYPGKVMKCRVLTKVEVKEFNHFYALVQPPIWIFSLMWIQSCVAEIQMAYVKGDDAIKFIEPINNLYQAYQGFMQSECTLKPLKFPLIDTPKEQILLELPDYLAEHVWSCEPQYRGRDAINPCGECDTCKKYKKLKMEMYEKHMHVDIVKKFPRVFDNMEWMSGYDREFAELMKTRKPINNDISTDRVARLQ